MLYDADRIAEAASAESETDLYQRQLGVFLDPNDPKAIAQARADGVPDTWIEAAKRSPVWRLAMDWRVAFPLHPEFRTLPMVWYVPPLSPIQSAAAVGAIASENDMPDVRSLRIPIKYLANMLAAGDEKPVASALERMIAMRAYMRAKTVGGKTDESIARKVGLTGAAMEEMYQLMAIAITRTASSFRPPRANGRRTPRICAVPADFRSVTAARAATRKKSTCFRPASPRRQRN